MRRNFLNHKITVIKQKDYGSWAMKWYAIFINDI